MDDEMLEAIPEKGKDFLEKLRTQLSGASDEVIDLAAEVVFVYYLIDLSTSGDKKRAGHQARSARGATRSDDRKDHERP